MTDLYLPWLEIAILLPLIGAIYISRLRDPAQSRYWSLIFSGLALASTIGAWQDFHWQLVSLHHPVDAQDPLHWVLNLAGHEVLAVDQLSAPLLPLVALLYTLTMLGTLSTKVRRFSFPLTLVSESLAIATFSCKDAWGIILLLGLATIPPLLELRRRGKSVRIFVLHMGLFIGLLAAGWALYNRGTVDANSRWWACGLLLVAILIRSGMFPFHCWVTDLFEHATFGTSLLFVTPIAGAYAAVRLLLPIAPEELLRTLGLIALFTAVYAAAMSLIQRDARRLYCFLFLSHAALVLVGLELIGGEPGEPHTTTIMLTGALCVWLSVAIALGGFGLTLRAIEARRGRSSLADFQGLYEHTPTLAVCFLLTGLASVGFPGTLGFIGTELLVDGAVEAYPYIGVAVVLAAALNGIAVVQTYFTLFTGTRHQSSVSLGTGKREQLAALSIAALILIGGFVPQINVNSRHEAAEELRDQRLKVQEAASQGITPSNAEIKPT